MGQVNTEELEPEPARANIESGAVEGAAEAKQAFEQGLQFLHEQRWGSAEDAFRRSLAIVPRDSTKYDLAYTLFKRDRIRQCLAILNALLDRDSADGDERYREYAKTLKPHVLERLATLRLRTFPAGATVTIDGETTSGAGPEGEISVDPGEHVVEVSAPGLPTGRFTFSAAPGGAVNRHIVLAVPASPRTPAETAHADTASNPPSSIHSMGPWLTMGAGGALLVASAITGVLASRSDTDFVSKCPSLRNCDPSLTATRDRALALGHASDALLISGAVFVAGGIAWKLLAPPPTPSRSAAGLLLTLSGSY
jgi:hypothetical protein